MVENYSSFDDILIGADNKNQFSVANLLSKKDSEFLPSSSTSSSSSALTPPFQETENKELKVCLINFLNY